MYYTDRELKFLRSRTTFVTDGDFVTNSRGERAVIESRANSFLSNYAAQRFNPNPTLTTEIPYGVVEEPNVETYQIADAAYWYFLYRGRTYGDLVKQELLYQSRLWTTDFSNEVRWSEGELSQGGVFNIAVLCHKYLLAYIFTKELFSATEKVEMDRWLFWIADYFQRRLIDYDLNRLFEGRPVGNYTISNFGNNQDMASVQGNTHCLYDATAGNKVRYWAYAIGNNRRWAMIYTFSAIYFYLKFWSNNSLTPANINRNNTTVIFSTQPQIDAAIQQFYTSADLVSKEFVKFSIYPDGSLSDYYRWSDVGNPDYEHESGTTYACSALVMLCRLGDLQKRHQLRSIWDYSTKEGVYNSTDGATEKSLRLAIHTFCKLQRHELEWYGTDTTAKAQNNYRLDFYQPTASTYKQYTCMNGFIPFAQYCASFDKEFASYLKNTYLFRYNNAAFDLPNRQRGFGGAFAQPQTSAHGFMVAIYFDKALTEFDPEANPYLGKII
jgi:hypothetical protein